MCTAKGVDKQHKLMSFETKSAELTGQSEILHCDIKTGDRFVKHLVRVTLLKKIYSSIKVTGTWIGSQSLLEFALTTPAAQVTGGWTETRPVKRASSPTQNFTSANIQRTNKATTIPTPIDIETKVEATPPWQPTQWYTVDTVGFAVNAQP